MKINYKQHEDRTGLPLVKAGIHILEIGRSLSESDLLTLSSFNGAVDWKRVSSEAGLQGSEIIFAMDDLDSSDVDLTLRKSDTGRAWHNVDVEVLTPAFCSPLSSSIHTVLAPAFAPGFVGTDWDDIKAALRRGDKGFLALVQGEPEGAMRKANDLIAARLSGIGVDGSVKAVLASLFLSESGFDLTLYRQAAGLLKGMYSGEQSALISVPIISDESPMVALLIVYDAPTQSHISRSSRPPMGGGTAGKQ
jgi:hypothetical protein